MAASAVNLESIEEDRPAVEVEADALKALEEKARALETRLMDAELAKARLEERAAALESKPAPNAAPDPTREQMQAWVDDGTITQQQMDAEVARQMRAEITREVTTTVSKQSKAEREAEEIQKQFDAYVEAFPEVKLEGNATRKKVFDEIQALRKLGMPNTLNTEVLAMRNVLGDKKRVEETTRLRRDVHVETGGSSSGNDSEGSSEAWAKGLKPGQVAAFRRQIDRAGLYSGPDDPEFKKVVAVARKINKGEKIG